MQEKEDIASNVPLPRGFLEFRAIKTKDSGRTVYIGAVSVFNLIDRNFITPAASDGLAPEILKRWGEKNGPVQRKTNAAHVQGILDYIVEEAEAGKPWTFNSIVLYSTEELEFEGVSIGHISAGEVRATHPFSVGEGLHRCLAWAVALGATKVRGVKRPQMGGKAEKRIELAAIPVLVIEESNLIRQKSDFNKLNRQKPLTSTVLALTDDSLLSDLTKTLIADVPLFKGRIDLNNASVGVKSDKLLAFAQLRFVVASYLLGPATRNKDKIQEGIADIVDRRGKRAVRADLKVAFTEVASSFESLARLHSGEVPRGEAGNAVRQIRRDTLLSSSAAWRTLFVAIHMAQDKGVEPKTAIARLRRKPSIWSRDDTFFLGTLIDRDTEKLLSNRESIEAASRKLLKLMLREKT